MIPQACSLLFAPEGGMEHFLHQARRLLPFGGCSLLPCSLPEDTCGSPKFPEPSLYSHALVSDPGGASCARHNAHAAAAFLPLKTVGLRLCFGEAYLMSTIIHISGLNTQPASSIPPASYSRYRVDTWSSLLTCRLTLWSGGTWKIKSLRTHWNAITNFIL